MIFQPALETADGSRVVFTSPAPWLPGTAHPTLNGRTLGAGFVELSATQVQFDTPPGMNDIVGFFVELS